MTGSAALGTAAPAARRGLSPRLRRFVLTAHIGVSVGLLGELAAYLAVATRGATTSDPALASASWDLLAMFGVAYGIPLSLATLASGLVLGLGGKWGVFRYPWVTTKLALIVSVILVGSLVLGPGVEQLQQGDAAAESRVIAGAAWNALALLTATALSVYKPGRARGATGREKRRKETDPWQHESS
jgi:uncharacterized membrane protein SirB2